MPKTVPLKVFLIGRTQLTDQFQDWLDDLGVSEERIEEIMSLENTAAEALISSAARQCYMSFEPGMNPNVTKTRSDMADYLDNVMSQGHGSVLAHATFNFGINNVSRVFTGEMNRHAIGAAISERSMRYIRFQDCISFWMPDSLRIRGDESIELAGKKATTKAIFLRAFEQMEDNYRDLCELWDIDNPKSNFKEKKQMTSLFRRIIGMGVATGGVWSYNVRALRHVLTSRCDPAAEEEIRIVAWMMLTILKQEEPKLFGDFDSDGVPRYRKV